MKVLYEILVPTIYGDTVKPIRTAHHREWDKRVIAITGGMTILSSARGKWTHEGVEYPEKVIPVRVMVNEPKLDPEFEDLDRPPEYDTSQITNIIKFTLSHYRQKAVMFYVVSKDVQVWHAEVVNPK